MNTILKSIHRFLISEDGLTAVEYTVLMAMGVIVGITCYQAVGTMSKKGMI